MKKKFLPIFTILISLLFITMSFGKGFSPNGSYKRTCNTIELKNYTLSANCKTLKGNYIKSTIEIQDFDDSDLWIINDNGVLKRKIKIRGSYKESCTNIKFENNTLYATCKNAKGNYKNSKIQIDNPKSIDLWIINIDGVLKRRRIEVSNDPHFWNSDGIDRSKWKETFIDSTRNNWDINCKNINCWEYDDKVRDRLNPYYGGINNIEILSQSSNTIPSNGHYIYLYRKTPYKNEIFLRENDRSGEGEGDIYIDNCREDDDNGARKFNKNCPSDTPYYTHVRHTQLNSPYSNMMSHNPWKSPIWCAGELRIENGRVCLINNDSGHFKPNESCLEYVVESLKKWKIPTKGHIHVGTDREYSAEKSCDTYDHEL